jgi:glucose/arabinose dehydrogenase
MKKSFVLAAAISLVSLTAAHAVSITTVTLVSNLNRPVWAGSTPALPNHLFVLEKQGVIKVIDMANANAVSTFMDINAIVHDPSSGSDEQGLLGMAFHPNYANNGLFYVYYTNSANTFNVVAQYTANAGLLTGNTASAVILLSMSNIESNHNGGDIAFGPDGKLYIGTGDGGGAGDVHGTFGNAQSLTAATSSAGTNTWYLGKMLRMDVDIPAPYIPSDNPDILGSGIDLKWMFGLRNPFRWSWDRANGDLYIGDVGQNAIEEVDYIPAGTGAARNLGWRCMEGNAAFNSPAGPNCTSGGSNLTYPVLTYTHSTGLAVIGGYVYRGLVIPGEQGSYFYGDNSGNQIWTFKMVGGVATGNAQRFTFAQPTAFAEDVKGEIYIVSGTATTTGTVRRVIPTCNNKADINADCAKDQLDIDILVNVLLEIPVGDPALVARSDINGDSLVDGNDIAAWINFPFP